jgi:mono/diheme cytochrome c family protein
MRAAGGEQRKAFAARWGAIASPFRRVVGIPGLAANLAIGARTATICALLALATLASSAAAAPPEPPTDARLARVYAIFDSNCAQCHQSGKLTSPAPGGQLANILALSEIAAEPHLVQPGVPDASRLYHVLLDRHRPLDLPADSAWPDGEDIQRVRTYIEELPRKSPACSHSTPAITAADIAVLIDAAVREAGEPAGRDLRFISLAHASNACLPEAEIEGYRQAVGKMLNSLSWGLRPVVPRRVDPAGTLLAIRLPDLGWIDDHWNELAAAEPPGVALDLTGMVSAPGASTRPIRADWLASAALEAPFYAELLGLPPTIQETARLMGINRDAEIGTAKAHRAGIEKSAITRGPRVIERHLADARRLWVAYDFLEAGGDRDILERPLGLVATAPERHRFKPDGMRAFFTLPNGYLAYSIFDALGRRISEVPATIETAAAHAAGRGGSAGCISCHADGPMPFTDIVRPHAASEKFTGARDIRDQVLAIYSSMAEWQTVVGDDAFKFRRALIQSGIDPDKTVHGLELIAALSRRYRLDVDLHTLAAEAGLSDMALRTALSTVSGPDGALVRRIEQGSVSRAEANALLARLKGAARRDLSSETALSGNDLLRLAVWTDRSSYRTGDMVTIHAKSNAPCHLTLIGIDSAGKATVLFPSEFEPDNLLDGKQPVMVPSASAPYQFRFRVKGAETILGICQKGIKHPAGIEPDYERQRFTVLGNYENFERAAFRQGAQAAKPDRSRPQRGAPNKEPQPADAKPEPLARAAVKLVIE